MKWKWCGCNLS